MRVAIIGGGACGLLLANLLEEAKVSYELFEKSLIGRKILASGNGKANIGNIHLEPNQYNQPLGYELVSKYKDKLNAFWKRCGLYTKQDEEGRIYPLSESSLSVLQCLLRKNLHIVENYPITRITRMNQKFYLNEVRGPFDYVVLATGSIASFLPKKQQGFYDFLNGLDVQMTPLVPSLVGFKLVGNLKRLQGVRIKCNAKLIQKNTILYQESGEVIFKNDGISGICVLNLSSYYGRFKDKRDCRISLDLLPGMEVEVESHEALTGLLHPKLCDYLKDIPIQQINSLFHDFSFPIAGLYDFEFAQVASGGIALEEINDDFSLKKNPHIYVGGELLDIDGVCGGYNLMFAFCSALKIGEELCNIK